MSGARGGYDPAAPDPNDPIGVAALMAHIRPEAPHYRADAFEDAPRIAHSAPPPNRLSRGSAFGLMLGGVIGILIIFVAGFLSAVMIFGEPSEGGDVTIRTSPAQQAAGTVDATAQPGVATPGRETIVSPAEAGREVLPPPSPEVAAAEQARTQALNSSGETGTATTAQTQGQVAALPPAEEVAPVARGVPEPVATAQIIYPPAKPVPPAVTAGAQGTAGAGAAGRGEILAPPGGNYSLQFGAFRNRSNAEALVREVAAAAQAGIVAETGASGNELFYVRAGAFETRLEALDAVQRLRDQAGVVTFVHVNRISG